MHPRNPYRNPPDFQYLARSYPPLAKYLKGHTIDFYDDAAQRCLTQALLKHDFGLELYLPPDRLCPPVPNRLNYVLWIQDIVATHIDEFQSLMTGKESRTTVRGLDIGTGASAIYPLLACKLQPEWSFLATELDNESFRHALANVQANHLSPNIRVVKVDQTPINTPNIRQSFNFDQLFLDIVNAPKSLTETQSSDMEDQGVELDIQFSMCNPPFYSSAQDVALSTAGKEDSPFGVCSGAPVEMITPGGEGAFVCAMIWESVQSASGTAGVRTRSSGDGSNAGVGEGQRESSLIRKKRRLEMPATIKTDEVARPPFQQMEPRGSELTTEAKEKYTSRWYTSMLGKLSSVVDVVAVIKDVGVANYALTEFVQGQTRRWAIGWSLGPWRLSDEISRIPNPNRTLLGLMPPHNTLQFTLPSSFTDEGGPVLHWIRKTKCTLADIKGVRVRAAKEDDPQSHPLRPSPSGNDDKLSISVACDTWSRRARRKSRRYGETAGAHEKEKVSAAIMAHAREDVNSIPPPEVDVGKDDKWALVCTASVMKKTDGGLQLEFRWVYGWDRGLFESFSGHVAKRVRVFQGS